MTSSLTKDVARVVRGIMALRGMQQKDLATAMGHQTSSNVSRWLKGGTFDLDTLDGMARALGMEPEHLVHLAMLSRNVDDGEMTALLASVNQRLEPPGSGESGRKGSRHAG